jgi:hypothetical protein
LRRAEVADFGERTRRCVAEALAAYRNDLFLAAANMMGAASEAAWHEIAEAMRDAGIASQALEEELDKVAPSVAVMQRLVSDALRGLGREAFRQRFGLQWGAIESGFRGWAVLA